MKICSYMRKVSIIWPVLLKLRQSIWNVHIWMYLLFIGRWNASILFWQLGWVRGLPSHFIPNNKRALWMSMIPSLIKLLASLCDTFWIIVRWHCFCSAQQNSVCRYTVAITPIDICRHRVNASSYIMQTGKYDIFRCFQERLLKEKYHC